MKAKLTNLWYFWDGPPIPPLCNLGVKSLKANADGFDIYQLNAKNIREYLPGLDGNWEKIRKWNWKVDFIKTRILYKYGGIFTDVDVICLEDLHILTDTLEKSDATILADGLGKDEFLSFSLLVAKPESRVCKKMIDLQDAYVRRNNWKVKSWHDLGSKTLNVSRSKKEVLVVRYQRAFSVKESRSEYLSRKNWTTFVRKTKGIPKPVIWPISFSSYFSKKALVKAPMSKELNSMLNTWGEDQWLSGRYMISSAFRHGLHLEKPYKILI
jgi:mannosyltransferase OCH1-like enzyme